MYDVPRSRRAPLGRNVRIRDRSPRAPRSQASPFEAEERYAVVVFHYLSPDRCPSGLSASKVTALHVVSYADIGVDGSGKVYLESERLCYLIYMYSE